jgi:hypothetical protein
MKSQKYCGTKKSVANLKRQKLIHKIRHFRDNWEKLIKRSMDQDDDYLNTLTVKELKNIMEFYTSKECKSNVDAWIPTQEDKINKPRKPRKTLKTSKTRKTPREKKCQKQTLKKYMTRKSPPYPANECKDDIKLGNDGLYYKSQSNKNGIYRWVKYQGL